MTITPDLAGLSLGGAYQAGLVAGFGHFRVTAYRQTWAANAEYLWWEVAPKVGYVLQTTSPGSGGEITDNTPPEGSFYTTMPEPGVPDQSPEPGEEVTSSSVLSFAYMVNDDHAPPIGQLSRSAVDVATGVIAWWEFTFDASAVPPGLSADMAQFNGPRLSPALPDTIPIRQDPLGNFSLSYVADAADMVDDVPQFERQSYEVIAVLRAVSLELARLDAAQQALTAQYFPATVDVLLPRWESLLGLPSYPYPGGDGVPDLQTRRALVLAYMQRLRTEGRGIDWIDALNALAGTNWNYREHDPEDPNNDPPVYSLNINIPQILARIGWKFVRDVTPAHLVINQGYTGGWLLGLSHLDAWEIGPDQVSDPNDPSTWADDYPYSDTVHPDFSDLL